MSASIGIEEARDRRWDVVVVGTGMGGSTLGFALARAGRRVLFCERGKAHRSNAHAILGRYPELQFGAEDVPGPQHRELLLDAGRFPEAVEDRSHARARSFVPFIGSGTGGSTALYGMALERFFPDDFVPALSHPRAVGSSLPDEWPISYEELAPFYESAERLFNVHGTADVLRRDASTMQMAPPPSLSPAGREIFAFLEQRGLHPYRLPQACEFVAECTTCQGYLCPRDCKNDGSRVLIEPAMRHHGASLLERCDVRQLVARGRNVAEVVCEQAGRTFTVRGDVVVLAAGGLATPRLLLQSASHDWAQGLANESGLVGRNLMRHCVDLHAVFTHARGEAHAVPKEIAFSDFHAVGGDKLGSVQSFGSLPPPPMLLATMAQEARDSGGAFAEAGVRLARPAFSRFFRNVLGRALVLASVMEDMPYTTNRVTLGTAADANALAIEYRLGQYERDRVKRFRTRIGAVLRPYRRLLIRQAQNNRQLAHACGTCRFGRDPRTSVLDRYNRAHGLDNLYVVDSSFFPTSGGTNPALTIAANALRVADHLNGNGNVLAAHAGEPRAHCGSDRGHR